LELIHQGEFSVCIKRNWGRLAASQNKLEI
jgi:hypothetical protein